MGNLTWNEIAETELDKRYMDMYGMSKLDMEDMLHEDMKCMLAMSILSDAQHVMEYNTEQARQSSTRDKYVLRQNRYHMNRPTLDTLTPTTTN